MAMTLRLADDESEALRRRAELEQRSIQEVARQAIPEYIENHSPSELPGQVLDEEVPRYAEALRRLAGDLPDARAVDACRRVNAWPRRRGPGRPSRTRP
jgi:Family of unknown function (DUF6290)